MSEIYEAWAEYHGFSRWAVSTGYWFHDGSIGLKGLYSDNEIIKGCTSEMSNL